MPIDPAVVGAVVLATVLISLTAWIGVLTLYLEEALLERLLLPLVALAAGSLIGGAFLHLLPRAVAAAGPDTLPVFLTAVAGFCAFYVLEAFLGWHHHHAATHEGEPVTYLVLVADALHNLVDGLVIAAAFAATIPLGVVTTVAVALHEVPQEIGDYGVLVHGGFPPRRALAYNFLTQTTVIVGGLLGLLVADRVADAATLLLPFAAGNFLYIASSDLVPEIQRGEGRGSATVNFAVFLLGVLLMLSIRLVRPALG